MSNEIQLSQDIKVITAEINSYKSVAGQAIFEIGRRLKGVRDNPIEYGFKDYRDWENWCVKEVEMTRQYANQFIKVFEELGNSGFRNLSMKVLYQIATLSEEERNKEHLLQSGEKKTVDEMTVKELGEVKRALKEKEDEIKRLETAKNKLSSELHEEKSKPIKVETKYIEKEIDNTDYEATERLHKELQRKEKSYILLENEKRALENKMKLVESQNEEFNNLKKQIQNLTAAKEDIGRQIEAATSISGLVVEVENFIKYKLAPVKYSKAIQEMRDDEIVVENLNEILFSVQSWCDEMKTYLPNSRKIIDMEVL